MLDQPEQITVAQACAKYGIEQKRLIGKMAAQDYDSPTVVKEASSPGDLVIADDWRVQRLAADKSNDEN